MLNVKKTTQWIQRFCPQPGWGYITPPLLRPHQSVAVSQAPQSTALTSSGSYWDGGSRNSHRRPKLLGKKMTSGCICGFHQRIQTQPLHISLRSLPGVAWLVGASLPLCGADIWRNFEQSFCHGASKSRDIPSDREYVGAVHQWHSGQRDWCRVWPQGPQSPSWDL